MPSLPPYITRPLALLVSAVTVAPAAHAAASGDSANIVYMVVLLALALSALFINWRGQMMTALRYGGIWIAIVLALVVAYAFRPEAEMVFNRVTGVVLPSKPMPSPNGGESFRKSQDGHYYIQAEVNGNSVEFMVDTGASTVVLPTAIAEDLGVDVSALSFTRPFDTANGQVLGAVTRLKTIEIGGITRYDIPAAVVPDLGTPLLGMSYFNTLSAFEVSGDTLTLKD